MVEKEVIEKINKFVKKLKRNKIAVAKVIVYGSRARGTQRKNSDIDVAIVSPDFGRDRYEEGARLFEIASTIDPMLEPVPVSQASYEKDTWLPLVYEIRENGIEIKI